MKRGSFSAALVAAALALAGAVASADERESAPGASRVVIRALAFTPDTVRVPVGDSVIWTNEDVVPHTVSQLAGARESGRMDPGASFSTVFDEPGAYDLVCRYHPEMTSTVIAVDRRPRPAGSAES